MTPEQRRIITSTVRGLRSSDAETVIVNAGQILKVIPYERVMLEELFKYPVETEETTITKYKPTSVIPREASVVQSLMSEVNREKLLSLLLEYEKVL